VNFSAKPWFLPKMSAPVCQVPGCTTTQALIESELENYLAGFCSQCNKPREGKLCGCAFPCSLTFKGQMLHRIHDLLGLEVPSGMKSIQVCYRHPELLRKAREACIAVRDQEESGKTASGVLKEARTEEVPNEADALLGNLEQKLAKISELGEESRTIGEEVTSIVYTDEGGREQSLVGKIVYQTDEAGQSNIIIQEVEPRHMMMQQGGKGKKLMRIDLGDMEGYMMAGAQGEEEALEQRLEEELEGSEARLEEELDLQVASEAVEGSGQLRFQLEHRSEADIGKGMDCSSANNYVQQPGREDRPIVASLQGVIQTSGIAARHPPSTPAQVCPTSVSAEDHQGAVIQISEPAAVGDRGNDNLGDNMLKIQYKEYNQKILSAEMRPLMSQAELCDTVLVCRDGRLLTSSLVLAGLSSLLRTALDSVPRIDAYKMIVMPEEITISQVLLLNKIIFDETSVGSAPPQLSQEQLSQVKVVSQVLGCEALLTSPSSGQSSNLIGSSSSPRGLKRSAPSSNPAKRRPIKTSKGMGTATTSSSSSVKLEKTELNADYIDDSGLVRLSSVDEMAVHYCLLCDRKFKKYNQAITHYDSSHNMPAALACDQCDETFRDMYSCVKHKHEIHGQFDANFQCYICKEVLYSRFRLGTHMKECHKQFFGEFVCRSCGMKFSAQYYLTKHLKETHTDTASTCNICQKSFSGRRYLTMHIKASHESGSSGVSESTRCKECDRGFGSARDKSYHASKVHGAPKPEGVFEDCSMCDKFFKTKGELNQHIARIHQEKKLSWKGGHESVAQECVKAEGT